MSSVFVKQPKSATMRLREAELRAQIEQARVRVDLLRHEKTRLEEDIVKVVDRKKHFVSEVEEKSSFLMQCFHGLAKEKANFREWMIEFEQASVCYLCSRLCSSRFSRIARLKLCHETPSLEVTWTFLG